jgi:hypothetical protein
VTIAIAAIAMVCAVAALAFLALCLWLRALGKELRDIDL